MADTPLDSHGSVEGTRSWFDRHKIVSSFTVFFLFISLTSCSSTDIEVVQDTSVADVTTRVEAAEGDYRVKGDSTNSEHRQEDVSKNIITTSDKDQNAEVGVKGLEGPYAVVRVTDGDTIVVMIGGKKEKLRLIGIDTPETVDPRKPVQCFGQEASNRAKKLLSGKRVYLEADPPQGERDKYDRLLRYVILEDGTNFNESMIRDGYAHEYTYNLPYKYQKEFKAAEKDARENKRGLWADDTCAGDTSQGVNSGVIVEKKESLGDGSFTCDCSKTCANMSSCKEAQYQLSVCGCSARDGDEDGVACDSQCQ